MVVQVREEEIKCLSIAEYASALAKNGTRAMLGAPGTFWAGYESHAVMRLPVHCLTLPSPVEVERVLWRGGISISTYNQEPDGSHPANAWLYVCRDPSYSLENLSAAGRRDVRRANRSLRFRFMDWAILLKHGMPAYRQTRRRVGLADGTPDQFQRRFEQFSRNPAHFAVGAWKEDILVGFMTLVVVDVWVAIEGSFSTDDHRRLCPNDGLSHFVLNYFLVQRRFPLVTYGLSSIQTESHWAGLHAYKQKVGFEAQPVHRAFVIHPLLRPFANRLALRSINLLTRLIPGNRLLKKGGGILASILGKNES